jgi:hypothetical protein
MHLKLHLKEKIDPYVDSTVQRCQTKPIKTFLILDFFHSPQVVNNTGGAPWAATHEFSKKFETDLLGPSETYRGNWFMNKTWSRKSRGTVILIFRIILIVWIMQTGKKGVLKSRKTFAESSKMKGWFLQVMMVNLVHYCIATR